MNKSEYSNAEFLLKKIREADAVLVGAASGLSAADGRRWSYVKKTDTDFRESADTANSTKDFLRFLP